MPAMILPSDFLYCCESCLTGLTQPINVLRWLIFNIKFVVNLGNFPHFFHTALTLFLPKGYHYYP